ncbi:MAG: hypothetical protein C5B54_10465, partial [Acidobacteria bacterium]
MTQDSHLSFVQKPVYILSGMRLRNFFSWIACFLLFSSTAHAIHLQKVVNVSGIVSVTTAKDGSGRIFLVQQSGRIFILKGNTLVSTPFLNIASSISFGGERGLLGLAFHPNYKNNGFFYVDYTDLNGNVTV